MKQFTTILAVLLVASVAWGEEPSRFLIDRIEVRGVARSRPEIVIAESRLSLGKEYDEREIDEAIYRIRRLPFVRDVLASLEKGDERGRYVLVLSVE